jgi:hypothetical protein
MTQSSGPDPFEFLKMMWGPMGLPLPGLVTPTLDVSEIDKRIAELKSVENWLGVNLNLLKMSIQGLEMQRATLSAMRGMQQAAGGGAATAAGEAQQVATGNPFADAWWNVLQQQMQTSQTPRSSESKDPDKT